MLLRRFCSNSLVITHSNAITQSNAIVRRSFATQMPIGDRFQTKPKWEKKPKPAMGNNSQTNPKGKKQPKLFFEDPAAPVKRSETLAPRLLQEQEIQVENPEKLSNKPGKLSDNLTTHLIKEQNKKITEYGKKRYLDKAFEIFQEMNESEDLKPTIVTYNALITACCKSKNNEEAMRVYEEMLSVFEPDYRTYSLLLPVFAEVKGIDGVTQLYNEALDRKMFLNSVFYTTVVKLGLSLGHPTFAIQVFNRMLDVHIKTTPSNQVLAYAIKAYGAAGQSRELEVMLNRCIQTKFDDNVHLALITAYGDLHQLDDVFTVWDKIGEKSVKGYIYMIEALCKANELGKAIELSQELDKMKGPTTSTFWSKLILLCEDFDTAMEIFENRKVSKWTPTNTELYNAIMAASIKLGNPDVVYPLYKQMMEKNLQPDLITFNILFSLPDLTMAQAMFLLKSMDQCDLKPTEAIYSHLLQLSSKQHEFRYALLLLRQMKVSRITPAVDSLHSLVVAFVESKEWDNLLLLFDHINKSQMAFKSKREFQSLLEPVKDAPNYVEILYTLAENRI